MSPQELKHVYERALGCKKSLSQDPVQSQETSSTASCSYNPGGGKCLRDDHRMLQPNLSVNRDPENPFGNHRRTFNSNIQHSTIIQLLQHSTFNSFNIQHSFNSVPTDFSNFLRPAKLHYMRRYLTHRRIPGKTAALLLLSAKMTVIIVVKLPPRALGISTRYRPAVFPSERSSELVSCRGILDLSRRKSVELEFLFDTTGSSKRSTSE